MKARSRRLAWRFQNTLVAAWALKWTGHLQLAHWFVVMGQQRGNMLALSSSGHEVLLQLQVMQSLIQAAGSRWGLICI